MKKIINRKTIKWVAIVMIALIAYLMAHKMATAERGYQAIGGEIFMPMLILFAKPIWQTIKAPFIQE